MEKAKVTKKRRTSKKEEAGRGDITVGTGDVVFGSKTTVSQGDYVGRDKITTSQGASLDDISAIFKKVYQQIDGLPASVDKVEVREHADTIREAAETGGPPDEKTEKIIKSSAQNLVKLAPDILEVIGATLASPAAGVAAVIRKVLDKAKAESSN